MTTTEHTAPLIGKQDCELDRRLDRLVSDHVTYPRAFLGDDSDSHFAGKDKDEEENYLARNPILWSIGPAGLCEYEIKNFILRPSAGR